MAVAGPYTQFSLEGSCLDPLQLSFMSMDGVTTQVSSVLNTPTKISTFAELGQGLDIIFQHHVYWEATKAAIEKLLTRTDFSTEELNKYTFWDCEKPYTRNLVATDNKHYTLLLLCWNAGKESKIHDHPCDGCFVKSLRGSVREARYMTIEETKEVRLVKVKFLNEGQIGFMNNDLGLHKIGNPNKDTGSVSMHLYTPPFKSCKVWSDEGVGKLETYEIAKMGLFSVFGHRTPHLEGKPGTHARVLAQLNAHFHALGNDNNDARGILSERRSSLSASTLKKEEICLVGLENVCLVDRPCSPGDETDSSESSVTLP